MIEESVFDRPRFRPSVNVVTNEDDIVVNYGELGCTIRCSPELRPEMHLLIERLREGGRTEDALRSELPLSGEQLRSCLHELDRQGLLTETSFAPPRGVVSGAELYREVVETVMATKRRYATGKFCDALRNGSATRKQLIGYAIEYWHLVRSAPGLIAPALAAEQSIRSRATLQQFFVSELNHDRFLIESLSTVGISADALECAVPLPMTFALCSALGMQARQDPLSFKAALFVFEEPYPEFNDALRARCDALGMPAAFWQPLLRHAALNDEGGHADISRLLLGEVVAVNDEERLVVRKNATLLIRYLTTQEQQILRYYGSEGAKVPRVFGQD